MEILDNHHWQENRRELRIQALELEGDYEQAQRECISWFEKSLRPDIYAQILKHAQSDFKESFKFQAIQKSFQFYDPHTALHFLIKIQEVEEGAKLVRLRHHEFNGNQYYTLRPAADLLATFDPMAATLLYRKMIQPILEETKSKYYNYAAKDLVTCGLLNAKISAWENLKNHDEYLKELEVKHKRKLSFWSEYRSALQKQAVKEEKQMLRTVKDNNI